MFAQTPASPSCSCPIGFHRPVRWLTRKHFSRLPPSGTGIQLAVFHGARFPASGFPTGFTSPLSAVRQCASGVAGARPVPRTRHRSRTVGCLAWAPYGAAPGIHEPPRRRDDLPPGRPSAACHRRSMSPSHAGDDSIKHDHADQAIQLTYDDRGETGRVAWVTFSCQATSGTGPSAFSVQA